MSGFSIRYPYFIIVICLVIAIVGTVTLVRMPVDLFPPIHIPVVVVATFYSGMPPEQIETNISNPFERWFTLASGVDHIESRSLPGVSLIKIYFQPGSNADADLSTVSNLAMADLRRLPPGTLPPVVLKFDASSLPVCLITLKGQGLNETQLQDLGRYTVRNQIANVPGASVPQPFGGRYRQIMVYVDPLKLEAHQLSPMDVVREVNDANLILPAGDVKIGPYDYNLYSNSQAPSASDINAMPLKSVGETQSSVLVGDVGKAVDAQAIQTNIVRVDGQRSVYLPILKQGGDTNTIAVVDGIKSALQHLVDIPKQLIPKVVFDQSLFVKTAISNVLREGGVGLILTGLMVLLFLGSLRATAAVCLSIPLSALASGLDVSFARVNLAEAQLLLIQARNDVQAAFATLSAAMGRSDSIVYDLEDEPLPPQSLPDSTELIARALRERPDLVAERLTGQAAVKLADAEGALWLPSVSAVAVAGATPYRQVGLNGRYSAMGVNLTVPLTNGGLVAARRAEASLRARAEEQRLRDLENVVARDVRTASLDA